MRYFQIYELESKISAKDARIAELEREQRNYKDIEEQQVKTIKQLRERLDHVERDASEISHVHSKGELAISTLQADNRQLQERILELESRLRRHLDDRDVTSQSAQQWEKNYEEVKLYLSKALFTDGSKDIRSHDGFMRRVKEFVEQYLDMKGRLLKLEDNLNGAEDEVRRNRDTVRKLLEDVDRTKQYLASTDIMKEERDSAMRRQKHMEDDLKKFEDRLLATREAWEGAQYELRQHQAKVGEMDATVRKHELTAMAASQEMKAFKVLVLSLSLSID